MDIQQKLRIMYINIYMLFCLRYFSVRPRTTTRDCEVKCKRQTLYIHFVIKQPSEVAQHNVGFIIVKYTQAPNIKQYVSDVYKTL